MDFWHLTVALSVASTVVLAIVVAKLKHDRRVLRSNIWVFKSVLDELRVKINLLTHEKTSAENELFKLKEKIKNEAASQVIVKPKPRPRAKKVPRAS